MSEPIELCLAIAGIDLIIDGSSIKGIPGIAFERLTRGEYSLYEIEKKAISFQISSEDVKNNQIDTESEIEFDDGVYKYYLVLETPPIPDLTGWSRIDAILTDREEL